MSCDVKSGEADTLAIVISLTSSIKSLLRVYSDIFKLLSNYSATAIACDNSLGEIKSKVNIKMKKRLDKGESMELKDIKTCELVEELKKREGVEVKIAEPHKDMAVSVNGPAVLLVVID